MESESSLSEQVQRWRTFLRRPREALNCQLPRYVSELVINLDYIMQLTHDAIESVDSTCYQWYRSVFTRFDRFIERHEP